MKYIIGGKVYDTEKSTKICTFEEERKNTTDNRTDYPIRWLSEAVATERDCGCAGSFCRYNHRSQKFTIYT